MLEQLLKFFVVFLVVVEPISLVPLFGALTQGGSRRYQKKMALKATMLSAIIFLVFALLGHQFLAAMGISIAAFKIGGGLLLFLIALDMVFARQSGLRSTTVREQEEARYRHDISVFPLGFPLIAGPGALATVLLVFGESEPELFLYVGLLAVIATVLLITLVLLLLTPRLMNVLGVTGANVISRLFGVILVALAVQYVVDGIRESFIVGSSTPTAVLSQTSPAVGSVCISGLGPDGRAPGPAVRTCWTAATSALPHSPHLG